MAADFITFGPVHLEVTNPTRTADFWRKLAGFHVRSESPEGTEVGTQEETLLVLHGDARAPFRGRYSGIYHVAIHSPNKREFARLFKRFLDLQIPISPTDHTFSKSMYLSDPDGITFEFALETPERLREVRIDPGDRLVFVDTTGVERSGGYPLDLEEVASWYEAGSERENAPADTTIGHMHLHVKNLEEAGRFYQRLGFEPARWWPSMQVGDLGAGGAFTHRIALNTWQGTNAPPSPAGTARMRHFEIRYDSTERMQAALAKMERAEAIEGGYKVTDDSGIQLRLALKSPPLVERTT